MIAASLEQRAVILVHGIGAHKLVMWPLKRRLERNGFRTFNFGYNSFQSIQTSAAKLVTLLQELQARSDIQTIDLVAHSMGCIVSRCALQQFQPPAFGRMVMLTPPSQGTPTADRVAPWLGWCVPALKELKTDDNSLVKTLPLPCYPFALIQARWDFLIPPAYVALPGASDHAEARTIHSCVLIHAPTHARVVNFLKFGRFDPSDQVK